MRIKMKLAELLKTRYTTKVFDPSFRLTDEQVEEIKTALQYSPSSTNLQPWHFIITGSSAGRERIAKAATGRYEYNAQKIKDASHVVVLCSKSFIDDNYLNSVLNREEMEGRFADETAKNTQHAGRSYYANMHRYEMKDFQQWTDKQVYIALGVLLTGVAMLGIDACPMEGFDSAVLNQEFNLREKGYTSSVIVALGRHSGADFNKKLPKSRLPREFVITEIS